MSELAQETCTIVSDQEHQPPENLVLAGFLRREDLAEQMDVSTRTLDRWQALGIGPPRVCVGRTILYSHQSVRDWLLEVERSRPSAFVRVRVPDVRLKNATTRSE